MTSTRQEVYAAIDSERDYQDMLWNDATTPSEGRHSPEEFLLFIEHYVGKAREAMSTKPDPQAKIEGLDIMRKIAGLAVACMEQNGAPMRVIPPAFSVAERLATGA
jgi:hypothetical protein